VELRANELYDKLHRHRRVREIKTRYTEGPITVQDAGEIGTGKMRRNQANVTLVSSVLTLTGHIVPSDTVGQ